MTRPLARSPIERGRRLMENRTRLVPGFISTNPRSTELDSLQQDFPPKSSQFGTCRPTNASIVTCGPCLPLIERPPPGWRRDVSLRQFCRDRRSPNGGACRHLGQNRCPSCCGSVKHGDLALSLRDFWRQCCWSQRQGSSWLRRAAGVPTLSSAGGTSRTWRTETCER